MNTDIAYKIILGEITAELLSAEELHPSWPKDKIHAVAIIVEEVGEAMQKAIDYELKCDSIAESDILIRDLNSELIQSAAMCIRALINLKMQYGRCDNGEQQRKEAKQLFEKLRGL